MQRIAKWTGVALAVTILYQIRFWVRSAQALRDPKAYETCAKDYLCRQNLRLGPVEWFHPNPDTYSYVAPIYSVLKGGAYQPDYRLPGLGLVYAAGYLVLGEAGGFWLLGLGGVLLWGLGQGIWAAYLERKGLSPWLLGLGILLAGTAPSVPHVTWGLLTEPYAGGLGLLGLYLLRKREWLGAGLCFTGVFFLRPVLGVWLLPTTWYVWRQARWRGSLLFLVPFCLTEGAWTGRNFLVYHDFRPLSGTRTVLSPEYEFGLIAATKRLLRLTGYEFSPRYRIPDHPANLFSLGGAVPPLPVWKHTFKELEKDPLCPPESLYAWGKEMAELLRSPTYTPWPLSRLEQPVPTQKDCAIEARLIAKIETCTQRLKEKKPWHRLSTAWIRLWEVSYLPAHPPGKAIFGNMISKIWQSAMYIFTLLSIILPYIAKGTRNDFTKTVGIISWLPIIAYLALEALERRYVDLQLPFALLHLAITRIAADKE